MENAIVTASNEEVKLAGEATLLLGKAKDFQIVTAEDAAKAADAIKVGTTLLKKANDERLAMTKPFRDGVDAINTRWNDMVIDPLKKAVEILRERSSAYLKKAREAAEMKRQEAAEAAAIGDQQYAMELQQSAIKDDLPVRGSLGTTLSSRKTWTYEVTDLQKVPLSFLMVNDAAVKEAMSEARKTEGGMESLSVNGLRFFQTESAAVR